MIESRLILITLLIKLGVAAADSAGLARSRVFQNLLFAEKRSSAQALALMGWFVVPLTLGVYFRTTVSNFWAADLAFETVILLSLLTGPLSAFSGAAVLSLPAMLHGEYLTLPFLSAVALLSSFFARFVEEEEVWSFSPFVDLSIYRWVRRNLRQPRFDRQILLLVLIIGMEISREWISTPYPNLLWALKSDNWWIRLAMYAAAITVVGIPLKIWNALRIEQKLEEQKRLLLEARFDALQRQINPHFLFNTLNSIASLVRFHPELAREMIVKLANILRALLKDHDTYVPFREELSFTDDYLGIEVVRFGKEKLKVEKEIDPATLDILVPSILLQPLIENSIKHGLEPRIHGGTITLRSRITGNNMVIEVEDDGVGIGAGPATALKRQGAGIGMKNVKERLEVLYGSDARFTVVSRPGRGTLVAIEMPIVQTAAPDLVQTNGEKAISKKPIN